MGLNKILKKAPKVEIDRLLNMRYNEYKSFHIRLVSLGKLQDELKD